MNYSDYTLISLGDSFTFGQGSYKSGLDLHDFTMEMQIKEGNNSKDYFRTKYRILNNDASYTSHLSKNMNFKNSVNLGTMGSSNYNTLQYLHRIINSASSNDKLFFCINLTCPTRHEYLQAFMSASRKEQANIFTARRDMLDPGPSDIKGRPVQRLPLNSVSKRFWEDYWVSLYTSEHVLYSHIKVFRELSMILKSSGCPYIIFDGINDTDYQIKRRNISFKDKLEVPFVDNMYEELQDIGLNITSIDNVLEEYVDMSSNFPHYFNFKTRCETHPENSDPSNRTVNTWAVALGKQLSLKNYGLTKCNHWDLELNRRVAKLLEDYIRKQEYYYLEK